MGTRSYIGMQNDNGTVTAIYCQYDGYPEHHGPILLESYRDRAKVQQLMALGNLSSLGGEIGVQYDWNKASINHDEDKLNTQCTAYVRDRGELMADNAAETFSNVLEFLQECQESFTYLYKPDGPVDSISKGGQWYYRAGDDKLSNLTSAAWTNTEGT